MAKVVFETKFRTISSNGQLRPNSQIFTIMNTGFVDLLIDGNHRLTPGESTSVNGGANMGKYLLNKISFANSTNYNIQFQGFFIPIALLIETHLKLID